MARPHVQRGAAGIGNGTFEAARLLSGVTYGTFLFDLDGTLIDSIELILRSYRHTLQTHLGVVPPDELWLQGLGTPIWVQLRHWTQDPELIASMVETYRVYNMEHHDALVRPYDGIVGVVEDPGKPATKLVGLADEQGARSGAEH